MYTKEQLLAFYETMIRIRYFEQRIKKHFLEGDIPGFMHLYIGEEAIATGVCQALTDKDYIASTHRGHGHTIAKGADIKYMMAELFGKQTGLCKGKGGSMHIADFSKGMLGANGCVGGGFSLATGAALAEKMKGTDTVSAVFFGDGASNRGTFHESLNMASVWKLPVIFVNENNRYAATTPYRSTTSVEDISVRSASYNIPGETIDGNDVFAVYETAKKYIERARAGEGPAIIECKTYRLDGHFVGDPEKYRAKEEVKNSSENNDPITRFENRVLTEGWLAEEDMAAIRIKTLERIEDAVAYAKESPYPDDSELFTDIYD